MKPYSLDDAGWSRVAFECLDITAIDYVVAFCREHDWGRYARMVDGTLVGIVWEDGWALDGSRMTPWTFKELRSWAGY